jgi:transcriptional regulator with PAS, ATPase and Fis domain
VAYTLVLFARGAVRTVALAGESTVAIGRAEDNDVVIDDASVSRHHARLHVGTELRIEDVGSVNGVHVVIAAEPSDRTEDVPEERVESATVRPGQPFRLGSIVVVVREGAREVPAEDLPGVIVSDPTMQRLHDLATRVAAGNLAVILQGETGVGKEIFAELIHARSPRSAGPFVRINCAAFSEPLLESELFGFERGAFTGATKDKVGLVESAHMGTLLLDEIGELGLGLQAKLLRVLEEKKLLRVGSVKPRDVDVRFIAATNRALTDEIAAGRFREDLYFRLSGVTITIPPLRQRRGEIVRLAQSFVARAALEQGRAPATLTEAARAKLLAHPWPGNIRELRNVMGRALLLCNGDVIDEPDLGLDTVTAPAEAAPSPSLQDDIASIERKRILDALEQCAGNQTRAAALLGMPRRTLVARLAKYGVKRPRS